MEVKEVDVEEGLIVARCCPLPVLSGNNLVCIISRSCGFVYRHFALLSPFFPL
jgi:hypothetical protein